jgi:hypothetical protein
LSGDRKIFIGSLSTLLYEAALAGHVVVYLDPELNGTDILFRFHFRATYFDMLSVIEFIRGKVVNSVGLPSLYPELDDRVSPALRFRRALETIEVI